MTRPATADPTSCRWPSRPPGPAHRRPPATPSATQRCRFALGNALLDTSIATWNAKCLQDTVRPISYIRWRYKGTKTKGWPGPGRGIGDVDGASWDPPGTVPSRGGQRGLHQLRRRRRPGGLVAALWRHPLRGRRPQGPNPGPPGRHGRVGQDGDLLQRHRHRSHHHDHHGRAHHPRRRPPPPRRRPRRPRHQRPPLRHRRRPLANPGPNTYLRWPVALAPLDLEAEALRRPSTRTQATRPAQAVSSPALSSSRNSSRRTSPAPTRRSGTSACHVARVPLIALLCAGYWISLLVALALAQRTWTVLGVSDGLMALTPPESAGWPDRRSGLLASGDQAQDLQRQAPVAVAELDQGPLSTGVTIAAGAPGQGDLLGLWTLDGDELAGEVALR
jgi:hypothetical protein